MPGNGHNWSQETERAYYFDNVQKFGSTVARDMSRKNIRSYRAEVVGQPTDWSLRVNEDGTDATFEDGSSLTEMIKNPLDGKNANTVTKTVRESAKIDIVTINKALELAANGHPLIIFPEHHVSDNGHVVRYFSAWKQDEHDKKLYRGIRIDLGKGAPINEARQKLHEKIQHDSQFQYHEGQGKHEAFVITTSQAADMQKLFFDSLIQENSVMVTRIAKDTKDTIDSAVRYITKKGETPDKEEMLETEPYAPRKELFSLLNDPENRDALTALSVIPEDLKEVDVESEILTERWKEIAQEQLHISSVESEQLLVQVQETWSLMKEEENIIFFVNETGLLTAAGLYALDMLTLSDEYQEDVSVIAEFVLSPETHAETGSLEFVMQLPQEDKDAIFTFFVETYQEHEFIDMKKVLPDGMDVDVFAQTIEFIRRIDELPSEEKEGAIVKEKGSTLTEIAFLYDQLGELVLGKDENSKQVSEMIHSPRDLISSLDMIESADMQEKEHVENFSIAIMIWMLLKMSGYYANLEFIHRFAMKGDTHSLADVMRKEKPTVFVQKEPAPWLLLSIIWYLTMIREQGMAQSQQQYTQQATPLVKAHFPDYGIIFASGS